jgi:hypothetical protein
MSTTTTEKAPPPPARRGPPPPAPRDQTPTAAPSPRFAVVAGRISGPQRVVVYGPGGIGKTSLAARAPGVVFIDVESGTRELDVPRVEGIESFQDLRTCLQSSALDGFKTVVIDSVTKVEELAVAHTLATVPHEKGHLVKSLEGYGFGKGLQHVYDTFLLLLQDLDRQVRAGRNVILIAHDCTADVPNPVGEDFIRFEPHLQAPKSGKASIRNRVIQWADHVLFLGYDVVAEDGKGKGAGTRTIWPVERPDHIAKSRILAEPLNFNGPDDGEVWARLVGNGGAR